MLERPTWLGTEALPPTAVEKLHPACTAENIWKWILPQLDPEVTGAP